MATASTALPIGARPQRSEPRNVTGRPSATTREDFSSTARSLAARQAPAPLGTWRCATTEVPFPAGPPAAGELPSPASAITRVASLAA